MTDSTKTQDSRTIYTDGYAEISREEFLALQDRLCAGDPVALAHVVIQRQKKAWAEGRESTTAPDLAQVRETLEYLRAEARKSVEISVWLVQELCDQALAALGEAGKPSGAICVACGQSQATEGCAQREHWGVA